MTKLLVLLIASNCRYQSLDIRGKIVEDVSAKQIYNDATYLATALIAKGQAKDRVIIPPLDGADFERAFFAVLAAGMIAVPLPKMPLDSTDSKKISYLQKIISDCNPSILIGSYEDCSFASQIFDLTVIPITHRGSTSPNNEFLLPCVKEEDIVVLQYTSGSTGAPKGVAITQCNLITNQFAIAKRCQISEITNIVGWIPTYHNMGLCSMTVLPIVSDAISVRISTNDFIKRPLLWLEAIDKRKNVWSAAPNFAYQACVRALRFQPNFRCDLSGWYFAVNGSEPVRESTMKLFENAFHRYGFSQDVFRPGYGMAESTLCVTVDSPGTKRSTLRLNSSALAAGKIIESTEEDSSIEIVSCGKTIDTTSIKILDTETASELGTNQIGEICILGPSVASFYWNNQQETQNVFRNTSTHEKILHTGDLGFIHKNELYICGRKKDLLIHAGENFFASDLEEIATKEIISTESTVCACFQTISGESHLIYEASLDPKIEKENCLKIVHAISKIFPGQITVSAVNIGQIPKTPSGKIQRNKTSEMYQNNQFSILATSLENNS